MGRQVGFYLPGDKFGLEADDAHTFSAEAITASNVLAIRRSAVVALADKDVTRRLWTLTNNELHDQERPGKVCAMELSSSCRIVQRNRVALSRLNSWAQG